MGCGGSAAAQPEKKAEGEKYKEEKKTEAKPLAEAKSAPAEKPAAEKKEAAPAAAPAAAAATPAAPAGDDGLPGRKKFCPGPQMTVIDDKKDKDVQFLVSAFAHLSDLNGLTLSCVSTKTGEVFAVQWSDDDTKGEVTKANAALTPEVFFKMLNAAFVKGDIKVTDGGAKLEFKLKQSKAEPKEVKWSPSLSKQSGKDAVYKCCVQAIPRYYIETKTKESKDKKVTEAECSKKEGELNVFEAILSAGAAAEEAFADEVAELRTKSDKAKAVVQSQNGRIHKLHKEVERLKSGDAVHPLDEMYACSAPEAAPKDIDVGSLNWDTDVSGLGHSVCDVGCSLFKHWELTDGWKVEPGVAAAFWAAVDERCNKSSAYHGSKRCIDCLACMHHLLTALKKSNPKLSKEDTLAAFLSAACLDLDHPGVDNTSIKRAGSMLAMIYSDLYMIGQNSLTVLFELMYNPKVNILGNMTPDEAKDIFETVREALFIKANVAMKTNMERVKDFEDLIAKGPDWGAKDNIRHQITHACRLCDWNLWARGADLHQKLLAQFKEEFYAQGDQEAAEGVPYTKFSPCVTGYGSNILDRFEAKWSSDRSKDADFASGQLYFIERCVEPLAGALARVAPELEPIAAYAKANKAHWDKQGGGAGGLGDAMAKVGKVFAMAGGAVVAARVGADGSSLWVTALCSGGNYHQNKFDSAALTAAGAGDPAGFMDEFEKASKEGKVTGAAGGSGYQVTVGSAKLDLATTKADGGRVLAGAAASFVEMRGFSAMKYIDRKIEDITNRAKARGNPAESLQAEVTALQGCVAAKSKQEKDNEGKLAALEKEYQASGGKDLVIDEEDALEIKVRNPLKTPTDGAPVPDRKNVSLELLKCIKSIFYCKPHAPADLAKDPNPQEEICCNVIMPYLSSDFSKMTKSLPGDKTQHVYDILKKLDDWDYDVFDLQTTMSGGISGENLRNQPDGGALFITMYALAYKWQFMQKFNIDEGRFLNWLSIVESGYHPNPYHNSMHAADVLHIVHFCMGPGGCQAKVKADDAKVFAALLSGCVHDFNHPGINNAFHVRCQNYLAVLFNDRSVNENIHASSVFELMRMDKFNILNAFKGEAYDRFRDDMVEFILGTDMGLHAMILSRFKKRIEETDSKLHKIDSDVNLGITMCVKLADISNCGRPQKLYHGWCNVIVDEFFQQGDRERLQGMAVSPFMDRYTTVMAKGQIGFMNYIVAPLFECMAEWLEGLSCASSLAEENKGFWQENEDW